MSSVNPTAELTRQLVPSPPRSPMRSPYGFGPQPMTSPPSGVAPGIGVGERAPDFSLPTALGEPVGLTCRSRRRSGGALVLPG